MDNRTFIIIFSAMMLSIGCTQLGVGHEQKRNWSMELESSPDGECRATVSLEIDDIQTDDTVTINQVGS